MNHKLSDLMYKTEIGHAYRKSPILVKQVRRKQI